MLRKSNSTELNNVLEYIAQEKFVVVFLEQSIDQDRWAKNKDH
jgi:hypothetical protein